MSYYDMSGATPYDTIANYGATTTLKSKPTKAFDNSPFNNRIYTKHENLYSVDYDKDSTSSTKGLKNKTPVNLSSFMKAPKAFDNSPFQSRIYTNHKNYYDVNKNVMSMEQYISAAEKEKEEANSKKATEMQASMLFLPNILKKISAHKKAIEMKLVHPGSKPAFTPAEQTYLNMVGNMSVDELYAKMRSLDQASIDTPTTNPAPDTYDDELKSKLDDMETYIGDLNGGDDIDDVAEFGEDAGEEDVGDFESKSYDEEDDDVRDIGMHTISYDSLFGRNKNEKKADLIQQINNLIEGKFTANDKIKDDITGKINTLNTIIKKMKTGRDVVVDTTTNTVVLV